MPAILEKKKDDRKRGGGLRKRESYFVESDESDYEHDESLNAECRVFCSPFATHNLSLFLVFFLILLFCLYFLS